MTNVHQMSDSSSNNDIFRDKSYFQRSYSTYDIGRKYSTNNNQRPDNCPSFEPPAAAVRNEQSNNHRSGMVPPDISSALPDFVQDHILVESFYKPKKPNLGLPLSSSKYYDQLPDFTINENEVNNM